MSSDAGERTPLQRNKTSTAHYTKLQRLPWWKRPSPWILFPVFGLYQMGQQMQKVIQPNLYISLACKEKYDFDISYHDERCSSVKIQEMVSSYTAMSSFIAGIAAVWIMPRISSLSDRYGRKFAFIYFLSLNVAMVFVYILALQWWRALGFRSIVFAFFLLGCSGTDLLLWVAISSYVADCVPNRDRTRIMSYSTAVEMGTSIFGPILASSVLQSYDDLTPPLLISLLFEILALVYTIFMLPESRGQKYMQRSVKEFKEQGKLSFKDTVISAFNVVKPIKVIWNTARAESHLLKQTIIALTIMEIGYNGATEFKGSPEFLYFQMEFGWSAVEIGYMQATVAVCKVIQLGALVPFLIRVVPRWLGEEDSQEKDGISSLELWLIRFGFATEIIGCVLFAYARNSRENYIAAVVESFGVISRPLMQSAFMNILTRDKLSEFLYSKGALAVLFSVALASGGMSIYSSLVKHYPVMIFIITAVMYLGVAGLSPFIKTDIGPEDADSDDDDDE